MKPRGVLSVGDRVLIDGVRHVLVGLSGTTVRLASGDGVVVSTTVAELLSAENVQIASPGPARGMPVVGVDGLPQEVLGAASWWERHIVEVLYGVPPDAPAGTRPRPEYDVDRCSLTAREKAKAAELTATGHPVSVITVKRHRQRYETDGLSGLVDHRVVRRATAFGRVDPRVVTAMRQAVEEATDDSSRTASFVIWRTEQILNADPVIGSDGEAGGRSVVWPSQRSLYRLFDKVAAGKHTTGSASTRRSLAGRPEGMFTAAVVAAPGEVMEIDSTPLDVMVLLDDGVVGRVELTGIIDVATRTVSAAVLRPTTRSVDASVLLARALTPEPMRPGWAQALSMASSVLPWARLCSIDERLAHAAAKPVIVPSTIVCDHGSVYISRNFRASCRHLGINFQPARKATGSDKPHIERLFGSVASLFAQFVSGYTGSNPDRRGRMVEGKPLWSMQELQDLLDEWLIAFWQNRPHDGLRDPVHPGQAFSPNQRYAALVETAGYVPVALGAADYIELLPTRWRAVNAYGIKIDRRTYDSADLNPLRGQRSGLTARQGLWEIHHDPYDVSRIHVRGPQGWITVFWRHLDRVPVPFGDLAWDHARRNAGEPGRPATEEQIADAVAALLHRAYTGPEQKPAPAAPALSRRDRRIAALTRTTVAEPAPTGATTPAGGDAFAATHHDRQDDEQGDELEQEQAGTGRAKVIPLGIFDPFKEAERRW
ncbi:MAG: putative transposase [Actinomycetota bacterium]|nr:putative transposase [Actinomycetota bacterium]